MNSEVWKQSLEKLKNCESECYAVKWIKLIKKIK